MTTLVADAQLTPLGYQRISLDSVTAKRLKPPPSATLALIQAEETDIRYRDDGVNPTLVLGARILQATHGIWYNGDLHTIRLLGLKKGFAHVLYYEV